MLKGISISLISLSLMIGSQVYAALESDLSNIPFKEICTGQGGSTELGKKVHTEVKAIIEDAKIKIIALNATLRENSNNAATKALSATFAVQLATFDTLSNKVDDDWSKGCQGS